MINKIETVLKSCLCKEAKLASLTKLHGDASYRTYYRARLIDNRTFVVMQMPPGKSSVSEEVTNFNGTHEELPFINVARFLGSLGLPAPNICGYSEGDKLMILEDAGDQHLGKLVKDADRETQRNWYKKAIDLLVEMQRKTSQISNFKSQILKDERCIAFKRSFDATLLNWEFDHFREYLIEARIGSPMEPADRKLFEEVTREITKLILKTPYGFTHRDFQSRNLMVQPDGSLIMLDFQDALSGPQLYDLVSLLRDSYVELSWPLVEELIEYYTLSLQVGRGQSPAPTVGATLCGRPLIPPSPPLEKGGEGGFHLITIQRKMKDAGRFVYIDRVKGNPNFLQYIPTSLKYVRNALERLDTNPPAPPFEKGGMGGFLDMLKTYVPEWK